MVEACTETRREDSECGTIWPLPEKTSHATHVCLTSRAFALPVYDAQVTAMSQNRAVRKMKFSVRSRGHAGVGPRHPGMGLTIRVEEQGPLGQEPVLFAKGVLNRPVHSKPELSFATGDIDPA